MLKKLTVAILGAGARGTMFGELMQQRSDQFEIAAICDINPAQLEKCKHLLNLNDDQIYADEESYFSSRKADIMVISTFDKEHVRQGIRAMRLGYDVLMEKPISDSRSELAELLQVQRETNRTVAICHELRYGAAYEKLSELLAEGIIGRLMAIDAMERVAYWHQAQAYVRIQSVRNDVAFPTILAKCSHDLDLIQHYAGSQCESVTSVGGLGFFRRESAPEGSAEFCLSCPYVETCPYSAKRIYIDAWKLNGCPEFAWPYNKVSLKKPTTEADLYEGIRTTYFGKCVFRCGNETNSSVVDHQLVQMKFTNGVVATLKMVFAAEAGRRINFFGTYGEILMDERVGTIEIRPFGKEKTVIDINALGAESGGHGGGDARLVDSLYAIFTCTAQSRTSLAESVESHLMGISAEESRLNGGIHVSVHK